MPRVRHLVGWAGASVQADPDGDRHQRESYESRGVRVVPGSLVFPLSRPPRSRHGTLHDHIQRATGHLQRAGPHSIPSPGARDAKAGRVMAPRPCTDCRRLIPSGGRCLDCRRAADQRRGTATQRGYGPEHRARRAALLDEEPWCHRFSVSGYPCPYRDAGSPVNPLSRHHLGAKDDPADTILCARCNSSLGAPRGSDQRVAAQPFALTGGSHWGPGICCELCSWGQANCDGEVR